MLSGVCRRLLSSSVAIITLDAMASAKRETMQGSGAEPQRGPGAEPPVVSGGVAP